MNDSTSPEEQRVVPIDRHPKFKRTVTLEENMARITELMTEDEQEQEE